MEIIQEIPGQVKRKLGDRKKELGVCRYKNEFAENRSCFLGIIGLVLGIAGLIILFWVNQAVGIGLLAACVLLFAIYGFLSTGNAIYYFDNGIVAYSRFTKIFTWHDLKAVNLKREVSLGEDGDPYYEFKYDVELCFENFKALVSYSPFGLGGKEMSKFAYFLTCRDYVNDAIVSVRLPQVQDQLKRGQTVQFGAISLKGTGQQMALIHQKETVSVASLQQITFELEQTGKSMGRFDVHFISDTGTLVAVQNDIESYCVLKALLAAAGKEMNEPELRKDTRKNVIVDNFLDKNNERG